jgi:hypothetical protein
MAATGEEQASERRKAAKKRKKLLKNQTLHKDPLSHRLVDLVAETQVVRLMIVWKREKEELELVLTFFNPPTISIEGFSLSFTLSSDISGYL